MTYLLAALLGNILAWAIHSFSWWLREKMLPICAILGVIPLSLLLTWTLSMAGIWAVPFWFTVLIVSWVQLKVMKLEMGYFPAVLLCLFFELGLATFIYYLLYYSQMFVYDPDPNATVIRNVGALAFCFTLVFLALLRSFVLRLLKWMLSLIRPQASVFG